MPKLIYRWVLLKLVMIAWGLLCFHFLVSFLMNDRAFIDSEIIELYYLKMMILTFPAGFVANLVMEAILIPVNWIGVDSGAWNHIKVFILWSAMTAAGYAQWFIIFPLVVSRLWSVVKEFTKNR